MSLQTTTVLNREAQFHHQRSLSTRAALLKVINNIRTQHGCLPLGWMEEHDVEAMSRHSGAQDDDEEAHEHNKKQDTDHHPYPAVESWTTSVKLTSDMLREHGYNYELVALAVAIQRCYESGVATYNYDRVEGFPIQDPYFCAIFSKASKSIRWQIERQYPSDNFVAVQFMVFPSVAIQGAACIVPKPLGLELT